MKRARLGRFKPMADFEWDWPKRALVERVLTLDFLTDAENLVLVGEQGLGKTMIAKNLVHQAILHGHSSLFTTAADLLLDLNGQKTGRGFDRRLRHYTRPQLLCIDEIGYLAYDTHAADLLFQIVTRRYEQKSIVLTTNLAFRDWHIFPNASCAVGLIDHLTHHAATSRSPAAVIACARPSRPKGVGAPHHRVPLTPQSPSPTSVQNCAVFSHR